MKKCTKKLMLLAYLATWVTGFMLLFSQSILSFYALSPETTALTMGCSSCTASTASSSNRWRCPAERAARRRTTCATQCWSPVFHGIFPHRLQATCSR